MSTVFVASVIALVLHVILPSTDDPVFVSWPSPIFLLTQIILSLITPPTKKKEEDQNLIISSSLEPPIAIDKNRLARFKKLVGHANKSEVPLLYPVTESFRLVIQTMVLPSFPVNILGSVLMKSRHVLLRSINEGEKLSWKAKVGSKGGIRRTIKGDTEIDIFSTASDADGQAVWKAVVTVIVLGKNRTKGSIQPPQAENVGRREIEQWSLDSSVGRRYGLLSGDLNPIHVHWTLSRLFGFKRPIAHALFLVAKAEACLRSFGIAPLYPSIIETEFKRPTLLPAKLTMKIEEEAGSLSRQVDWSQRAGSEMGLGFAVTTAIDPSTGQQKDVIVGRLWQGKSAMKKAA